MSIASLKAAYIAAAETIKATHRANMLADLASAKTDLNAAVVAAYTNGGTVAAICREYGTSSRSTIITILTEAGVYVKGTHNGL